MTIRAHRSARSDVVALLVILAVLASWNLSRSTVVPGQVHLPVSLFIAGVVVAVGWAFGLTSDELGTRRDRLASGWRWGAGAFAAVTIPVALGGLLSVWSPRVASAFEAAGIDLGLGELIVQVAIVIPIGTVLVEEVIFRAVVLGLLLRATTTRWAVTWASVIFGLWHVFPALRSAGEEAGAAQLVAIALGVFAATAVAGVVFCWLRLRSQSLLAPSVAHLATNTVPMTIAWLVIR